MNQKQIHVDLSGLTDAEYLAIEDEAKKQGIPFDEAVKYAILQGSRSLRNRARLNPVARLLRFSRVH